MFIEENPEAAPTALNSLPLKDSLMSLDASFRPVINTWAKGSTVLPVIGNICKHTVICRHKRYGVQAPAFFSIYILSQWIFASKFIF